MKLLTILFLLFAIPLCAQGVISPSPAVVKQGTQQQFTCTSNCGTSPVWSCSGTDGSGNATSCAGSITAGGLYTSPAIVTAQHTFAGFQLLPNNHVYNTRIDGLPLNSNNAAWIAAANIGGQPNWSVDFPVNYLNNSSPTQSMSFYYTTGNNGTFSVPTFPTGIVEHGWYHAITNQNADHHVIMVNTQTGLFSEFYQFYASCQTSAASVSGNVATLTCTSNPITAGFTVGASVCVGSFTSTDVYFNSQSACPGGAYTLTAVTPTTISYALTHANASASTNGSATLNVAGGSCSVTGKCNSQSSATYNYYDYGLPSISTDAAGMQLQPLILDLQEFEQAVASGGSINHAFRNTFATSVLASSNIWPATTFASDGNTVPFGARARLKSTFNISSYSAAAQILLTALKNYGMIVADGGNNWPMNAEYARWPKLYYDALTEVSNIGATLANNMEFVDESGLMVAANQTCPTPSTCGLTTHNREIITYTSSTGTVSVDVALQGVALNLPINYLNVLAGAPSTQLTCLVNIGGCTWSLSPAISGVSLTSGGLLTVGSSVAAEAATTITATSNVNASVAAQMTLTAFPVGSIYVIPSQTTNYTDSFGNVWIARSGVNSVDNQGCCACDHSASFPAITDVALYNCQIGSSSVVSNDVRMEFFVPNGPYQVTFRYGTELGAGSTNNISVNGTLVLNTVDFATLAGGQYKPFSAITQNVTVTNNQLSVVVFGVNNSNGPVSSLSIIPGSVAAQQGRLP